MTSKTALKSNKQVVTIAVIVAALGYFVDIYDLLLFSIVRVQSLKSIGIPDDLLLEKGMLLINAQMAGLLLGGIFWGILGDKKGRLSVLFGSIFIYSGANIINGFIHSVEAYAVLRFIAGVGLAGELGAGITLVAELMGKQSRGYGTAIVASFGILGAVLAAIIGENFDWRTSYIIGGAMGFALLILRIGVSESGMFQHMVEKKVKSGDFLALFKKKDQFIRYICVIVVGIPIWYLIGILITFSPEFGKAFGMFLVPSAGKAVMYCYIGLAVGDLASGLLSQWLKSRKKVFVIFILLLALFIGIYFVGAPYSLFEYYALCIAMGFAAGYWAIFVTAASEQFGINIRSTVTTTAPNFVRGSVIPLTFAFQGLIPALGIQGAAISVGAVTIILALLSLKGLKETFGKDLAYFENH